MSSLFPDVVACINIQVLEVKKMVRAQVSICGSQSAHLL